VGNGENYVMILLFPSYSWIC